MSPERTPIRRTVRQGRWSILAIVSLLLLVGASWAAGDYLWYRAAGRVPAFFVYTAWMALILLAAAGLTSLAVRLLFPDYDERLRDRAPGKRQPEDDFLEIERTGARFQPLAIYYSLIMVGMAVGAMFMAQNLSRGALFDFKVIQLEAMSRSADTAELQTFFAEVRELQQPHEVIRFVEKLPLYFEAEAEAVRAAAFETTEVMAHRMNLSVYLLNQEGSLLGDRWEPELLLWMHSEVAPRLRRLYVQGVTPQPAIVAALARIASPADFDFFVARVKDPACPDATFAEAAVGLGNLARFEGAEPLVAAIAGRSGIARARIFWALERIGNGLQADDGADEEMDGRVLALVRRLVTLFPSLDDAGLCGAVQAIRAFQHSGITDDLIALFDSDRGALVCPRVELQEPVGPPQAYIKEDRLRWLLLNVLADVGAGNRRLYGWAQEALTRSYDEQIMRGLRQLHGQLAGTLEERF